MTLLLPSPPLPFTVLPLHFPSGTLTFPKPLPLPSYEYHHQRRPLRIPTRTCASLSSSPSSSSSSSASASAEPVLSVLRSHGIPDDACENLLSKFPGIFRRIKPLENLDPKLQLLRSSAGLSGAEVAEILLANPYLLVSGHHPKLSSFVTFLASVLPSKRDLVRVLKSVICCPTDRIKANLQALRNLGAPDRVIQKMLLLRPRCLYTATEEFLARLETVKRLGLSASSDQFAYAVNVVCYMPKETFSRRVELLKKLGWSEKQVFSAFTKQPEVLALSVALLRKKTEFFEEVLGWGSEFLSSNPSLLTLSLEKRIIPRCAVLNLLMMKGLLEKKKRTWCPWRFQMANSRFFAEYVHKYEEVHPEVLEAYQGDIEFTGWGWLKDVPVEEEEAVVPTSS